MHGTRLGYRRGGAGGTILSLLSITLLAWTLLWTAPAAAQTDQTGVIAGRVAQQDGGPVEGAVVLVAQADGSYARDAVTDPEGEYRVGFLTPGVYTVTVQAPEYRDARVEGVRVRATRVSPVNVAVEAAPAEFSEVLTVTAQRPLIDATTSAYDSVVDARETDLLPTSRTATQLIEFTPGARPDQVWGGSTDQANNYQLDGVPVNQPGFGGDFLLPNVDWIDEFQVKGLGAGAEYGNFQGGLVNIVTKSGTNTLEGGVRFNLEDQSWNDSNLVAGQAGEELDQRWEANASLGGPAVRDRLYYFVSAQQVRGDVNVVDVESSRLRNGIVFLDVQEERTESKLFGKMTWQATGSDQVSAVLGSDDVETDNRGLDSFTAPAAAQTQESPALFYNLSWQKVIGSSNFLEVKVTGYDGQDDRLPLGGEGTPAVQILGGDRNLFANALYTRERDLESNAVAVGWDLYADWGGWNHELKIGGEYETGDWLEQRRRNGGLTWRPEEGDVPFDPDDPSTWGFISSDWGGDIRLDAETVNASLYVQDYVRLSPRLTVTPGLRWNRYEGELTPGFSGGPSFTAIEDDSFDPRLGVVWDVRGDGRWVGKAHYGRYHQNLFALLFDRVEGGDAFQDLEFWDWIGDGLPDPDRAYTLAEREQLFELFDSVATGEQVGPALDYEQPYMDQLVVGLEHALGPQWKVGMNYVRRENENIVALVDRNLDSNYTAYRNVTVVDFETGQPVLGLDGNPLVLPRLLISNADILRRGRAPGLSDAELAALTFDQDLVLTNPDGATREMDQVQLVVERFGGDWSLNASVVWTDLVGNFFSVSGYEDPGGVGAGGFVEPNLQTNWFGELPNSSEWEGKVRASGNLPWGLRGGAFVLYRSGDRYTPFFDIDTRTLDFFTEEGDLIHFRLLSGVNGEDVFLEDRGSRELPSYTVLDLHLDRPIRLTRDLELLLALDVFNVFNEDAVVSLGRELNTDSFDRTLGRIAPRTVRLNVGLRF